MDIQQNQSAESEMLHYTILSCSFTLCVLSASKHFTFSVNRSATFFKIVSLNSLLILNSKTE